jgi:hypothetical protein
MKIIEDVLVHGAMIYECEKCGKQWRMFLEVGVGGKDSLMTMPFMIGCACGGIAKHIDWHRDTSYPHPMPVNNEMSYFKLDREGLKNNDPMACGIPVVNPKSRDLREGGK